MRHLTNLESDEMINAALKDATEALNENDPWTAARLNEARARYEGHQATMTLLRQEFGNLVITDPKPTKWKSTQALKQQGYVGIYQAV